MHTTPATSQPSRRLALSYMFVEERADDDWGDVWVWDMDDRAHPTVEWLGCISRRAARILANACGYPLYGSPSA